MCITVLWFYDCVYCRILNIFERRKCSSRKPDTLLITHSLISPRRLKWYFLSQNFIGIWPYNNKWEQSKHTDFSTSNGHISLNTYTKSYNEKYIRQWRFEKHITTSLYNSEIKWKAHQRVSVSVTKTGIMPLSPNTDKQSFLNWELTYREKNNRNWSLTTLILNNIVTMKSTPAGVRFSYENWHNASFPNHRPSVVPELRIKYRKK